MPWFSNWFSGSATQEPSGGGWGFSSVISRLRSYVGLHEDANPSAVAGFNKAVGLPANAPWCTSFLTANDASLPQTGSVAALKSFFQSSGNFVANTIDQAKVGDIAFFSRNGNGHVARITGVTEGGLNIIHGNFGNEAREDSLSSAQLDRMGFVGYGSVSASMGGMNVAAGASGGMSAPTQQVAAIFDTSSYRDRG